MVLQRSLTNAHVLALAKVFVFLVEHLCVPDLVRVIDHAHFGGVLVQSEQLENLDHQIEVKVLVVLLDDAQM